MVSVYYTINICLFLTDHSVYFCFRIFIGEQSPRDLIPRYPSDVSKIEEEALVMIMMLSPGFSPPKKMSEPFRLLAATV